VRLFGINTNNLVKNVLQVVLKVSEAVQEPRKDDEFLKLHVNNTSATIPVSSVLQTTESSIHLPTL
jgi:hypothetical protein